MKEITMSIGKMIGNINVLDLRKATEATVAEIGQIGNVNVVIYSPETAGLVVKLPVGNMNLPVEVAADVKVQLIFGNLAINQQFLSELAVPILPVVMGTAIVETAEIGRAHV
jgi:hypothetical protein